MSDIVIINSGLANIASVVYAFKRLNIMCEVTTDPETIQSADHVVLPGVGAAGAAMQHLSDLNLINLIPKLTQPVLGICLGMQLLFSHSAESDVACLNIIPGTVERLPHDQRCVIPHMGWNQLSILNADSPLLFGINTHDYVYFVHSYAVPVNEATLARCDYGQSFSAVVAHKNFYAVQFHPERSTSVGAQLLKNFVNLK